MTGTMTNILSFQAVPKNLERKRSLKVNIAFSARNTAATIASMPRVILNSPFDSSCLRGRGCRRSRLRRRRERRVDEGNQVVLGLDPHLRRLKLEALGREDVELGVDRREQRHLCELLLDELLE